jgi:hypothetical protein
MALQFHKRVVVKHWIFGCGVAGHGGWFDWMFRVTMRTREALRRYKGMISAH